MADVDSDEKTGFQPGFDSELVLIPLVLSSWAVISVFPKCRICLLFRSKFVLIQCTLFLPSSSYYLLYFLIDAYWINKGEQTLPLSSKNMTMLVHNYCEVHPP